MYALDWAENVVKAHYRAHPRASYFLLVLLELTTKDLAKWLARSEERWELYKSMVKLAENRSVSEHNDPGVSLWLRDVDKMLQENEGSGSKYLLTLLMNTPTLKKHWLERLPSADQGKIRGDLPGQLHLPF